MTDRLTPRIGAVVSADIAVPQHSREIAFYSSVLTTGKVPLWREDLMNNRGIPIIGLGERTPEYAALPLQWMPHIYVSDVARSARRAAELGGAELLHERDELGTSQWAVLIDISGAAFGIIQYLPDDDVAASEEVTASRGDAMAGCIAWLDLSVPDATASCSFYQQVVGWSAEEVEMDEKNGRYADYNMLDTGGSAAAGICHAYGINLGLPPVWLLHLPVGDLGESLRRVRDDGGTIIKASKGTKGEFAVIRDPVGAFFALVQG